MPLIKDSLITSGTTVYPFDSYVRIAKVLQVSLFSREMVVQFIDGETDETSGDFLEEPVTATCIVGSDDPSTTYAPSCTVYGRGDLANILVLASGQAYAISLCDLYTNVNRENFATIKGWALYDVLNGMLMDFLDDGENSYLTFYNFFEREGFGYDLNWSKITKITGDPNKRHIMRRMLDYFTREQTQSSTKSTDTDPLWGYTKESAGPDNNPMRKIHGRTHKGYRINGFPYVEDVDFTNDVATLDNNITAYHSTLENLKTGDPHPMLNGVVTDRFWDHSTIIWWEEEEPTHVVLIGAYPAWDSAKTIVIAEVPVYSMCGRKFLEREIVDEGLPGEYQQPEPHTSWQLYGDNIRVLATIDRTQYADFLLLDDALVYSEQMQLGVVAYVSPTQTGALKNFGILDGHPAISGGDVLTTNATKRILGTIERTAKLDEDPTEANGSRWDYELIYNNPITTGTLDLSTTVRYEYEYNEGYPWERQTTVNPNKEFNCYNDGVNSMESTIEVDYYCDGYYPKDYIGGRVAWSDAGGLDPSQNQLIENKFWQKYYRNGGHVWTNYFEFNKTSGFGMNGRDVQYAVMYADVEFDLFVVWKTETIIENHDGVGPSWLFQEPIGTHRQYQSGVVIFEGTEWYLWRYEIYLDRFPTMYNFFPWAYEAVETGVPLWPGTSSPAGPYSIDTNHNSIYCLTPQYSPYLGTLKTGMLAGGMGFPAPVYGPNTFQVASVWETANPSKPDDLLQVSIDRDSNSFIVRWESFYQTDTGNYKYLSYPNGNTLYMINGGMPHFNEPAVTNIIEL